MIVPWQEWWPMANWVTWRSRPPTSFSRNQNSRQCRWSSYPPREAYNVPFASSPWRLQAWPAPLLGLVAYWMTTPHQLSLEICIDLVTLEEDARRRKKMVFLNWLVVINNDKNLIDQQVEEYHVADAKWVAQHQGKGVVGSALLILVSIRYNIRQYNIILRIRRYNILYNNTVYYTIIRYTIQ